MSDKKLDPIQLTAYFSEKTASKEDLEFICRKLASGMQPADLVRKAIRNYRKNVEEDNPDLATNVDSFLDQLSNKLVEKLSTGQFVTQKQTKEQDKKEASNQKAEAAFDKRRANLAKLGLARKRDE